jgi:hypothetical protein
MLAALANLMIANKKTDIIDDFVKKVQSHAAAMRKAQRIDDLEAVLRTLVASDDERAIEMSDKIRDVIERKHLAMEKRLSMLEKILRQGGIHV